MLLFLQHIPVPRPFPLTGCNTPLSRSLTHGERSLFHRYSEKRLQAPHAKEPSFRFTAVLHFPLAAHIYDLTGFNDLTGGKTKKKTNIAGLPTEPFLGKMQDQDECPGLLILQVVLIFLQVSVAILHFIHGRQLLGFLFFFSLFSFLLRNVLFVQIKSIQILCFTGIIYWME
ncbi:hypothetical protein [uncultured Draconibacterium sp.]|uniref:hypothetical protein n=1 Tax=uncultured Draconibacterium sp. TaxID=1573823 RepID=UPI00262336C1|nr:hypothetical protein [uncultured Draconibacterium sp.]